MLLLLLLVAVDDDRRAGEADADAARPRRARLRHLLVEDELLHDGHAGAAVLLRPGRRDPPLRRQLLHPRLVAHRPPARRPRAAICAAPRPSLSLPYSGLVFQREELAHFRAKGCVLG